MLIEKDILNNINEGILVIDEQHHIVFANSWYKKKFNLSSDYENKKCFSVVCNRNKPCENCPTVASIYSNKTFEYVLNLPRIDDKTLFSISASPFNNNKTKLILVRINKHADTGLHKVSDKTGAKDEKNTIKSELDNTDISHEIQYDNLAKREKWQHMAQTAGKVSIWELNMVTNKVRFSEEFARIHGIENRIHDLNEIVKCLPPGYENQFEDAMKKALEPNGEYNIEHPIIHQITGKTRWVHARGRLVYDDDEKVEKLIGSTIDITVRMHALNEIVESEKRLDTIFNTSSDLMALISVRDKSYYFEAINKAYSFGVKTVLPNYDVDNIIGTEASVFMNEMGWSEEFIQSVLTIYDKIRLSKEVVTTIDNIKASYGTLVLNSVYTPVIDKNNECQYILYSAHDVTSLKKTEEELRLKNEEYHSANNELNKSLHRIRKINNELIQAKEQAEQYDKLKTTFLANLSHEIRTPMNGILGFADLLKKKNLPAEKHLHYLDIIQKSGARMLALINDLVNISKIESGQMELHYKLVDVNGMLSRLQTFFTREAEKKSLKVHCANSNLNDELIIHTDEVKLEQILNNLLTNAIKFTHQGNITFGYEKSDEELTFYVKDTGSGISEEHHKTIFDRFRQVEDTPYRDEEGSGLGLAIAKSFVELLRGKIWLESEVGTGSTFFFTLPVRSPEKIKQDISLSGKLTLNTSSDINIIIAEDDEVSFQLIKEIIDDENIHIIHARNGQEVVDVMQKNNNFDIILMDIKMALLNGIEATRLVREINSEIPIIAQTAYVSENDIQQILQVGCTDYISKPINANELLVKLKYYLNR